MSQAILNKLKGKYWRMNHLYFVKNEKGQRVRFRLKDVQDQLYKNLWYLSLILKSRQHGITTFFCINYLDDCLFNPNLKAGIIAHNREDAEAFFTDKVRYAYDQIETPFKKILPTAKQDSTRSLQFDNDSGIRVGTSLRSGTNQRLHISEFGKICAKFPDKAEEIVTGALNTVHVGQQIAIESTAEGNAGAFYDYCMEAQKKQKLDKPLSKLDWKFFFFPWWADDRNQMDTEAVEVPEAMGSYFGTLENKQKIILSDHQKAWYSKKAETQGKHMKREYPSIPEEAFEASIEGAYFSTQFEKIYEQKRICDVPCDPKLSVSTYWDLGVGDTTDIWFIQEYNIGGTLEYRVIDFYENSGEGLPHYISIIQGKPYTYDRHVAPHDIEVREVTTGVSRKATAAEKYKFYFETAPKLPKEDQIDAARAILPFCYFDEQKCAPGVKALENYRKKWNDKLGNWENKPLHDWASNAADAYQVFAVMHNVDPSAFGRDAISEAAL